MNDLFLGIIAAAVAVMAVIQVWALITAARVARRVERLTGQIEREIKPLFHHLHALTADAARATSIAAAQVERADRMFDNMARRVDQTLTTLQNRVIGPARDGAALLAGLRAALASLRDARAGSRKRPAAVEEEDALFIG